jgi:peroxiredoxin
LRGLQQRLKEIHAAGGQLVAITPELPDDALSTQKKHQLAFHVLSDTSNQVAKNYGVVFNLPDYVVQHDDLSFSLPEYYGDESYTLPLSASYVINEGGVVTYAYLDADYRNRAPIDELIHALTSN